MHTIVVSVRNAGDIGPGAHSSLLTPDPVFSARGASVHTFPFPVCLFLPVSIACKNSSASAWLSSSDSSLDSMTILIVPMFDKHQCTVARLLCERFAAIIRLCPRLVHETTSGKSLMTSRRVERVWLHHMTALCHDFLPVWDALKGLAPSSPRCGMSRVL
jgi:hypothetical protein